MFGVTFDDWRVFMFFEEVYMPRPCDYDKYNNLSYEALLHILEDASSRHSAYVNDSLGEANS